MKFSAFMSIFPALAVFAASASAQGQTQVYVKMIGYEGQLVPAPNAGAMGKPGWLEVDDFSFDVEQTERGMIGFNPLSFTLRSRVLDSTLLIASASGSPYKEVDIEVVDGRVVVEQFTLKLAYVKKLAFDAHKTKVFLQYGGLFISTPQSGGAGWNAVNSKQMTQDTTLDK